MLPPLNCVTKYNVRGSVVLSADTAEKWGWVWECEYDFKCDWIKEWGKVNGKIPEYTFKSSMSIGIKTISPNQKLTMLQEYKGGSVISQSSAKSSSKVHNTATTGTLIYYGLLYP